MTLNISLIFWHVMAQSSDLRLTNPQTGALVEVISPEVDILNFAWRAIRGLFTQPLTPDKHTAVWYSGV
jgi:hypothetical protein